jgi:proteasome assembly chaperone (PAC2) family protein
VVKDESCNMEKTPSHLWDPKTAQRVLQNKEVST